MSSKDLQTSIPQRSIDAYLESPRLIFAAGSAIGAAAALSLILLLLVTL